MEKSAPQEFESWFWHTPYGLRPRIMCLTMGRNRFLIALSGTMQ
jgi:hypothetical protein